MPSFVNLTTGEIRHLTQEEAERFFDNRPPQEWDAACPNCLGDGEVFYSDGPEHCMTCYGSGTLHYHPRTMDYIEEEVENEKQMLRNPPAGGY